MEHDKVTTLELSCSQPLLLMALPLSLARCDCCWCCSILLLLFAFQMSLRGIAIAIPRLSLLLLPADSRRDFILVGVINFVV